MRGGIVKVHSGMTQEPLFGGFVLVDVEVVQHDVKGAYGVGLHDVVHETQKVHRGPPVSHMGDYFAGGNLQGGQQGLCAMTDVFVGPGAGFASPQREPRLGSVERLDARFLVHTQHQRILRRVEIQPNNVQQLGFKIRVRAEGERADSVGLQFGGNQHGMHRTGG